MTELGTTVKVDIFAVAVAGMFFQSAYGMSGGESGLNKEKW